MKKIIHIALLTVLFAFVLSITTYGATTLPSVIGSDIKKLPFDDVHPTDWFFKGVYVSNQYNMMGGMSNTVFSPNTKLTVAQAITLASRLHAHYNNQIITSTEDKWYDPYISYARKHKLLPTAYLSLSDPDKKVANRYEAAYLFFAVLKDTGKIEYISDASIPDYSEIPVEYRESVMRMYFAGIITGMGDGSFSGKESLTRGQAATIMMRILDETQRVAYDSRYNYDSHGQEGNQDTYGFTTKYLNHIAYNGSHSYYVIYDSRSGNYSIIKRDRLKAQNDVLYIGNGHVHDLIIRGRYLYFQEDLRQTFDQATIIVNSYINRIDINSNKFECVFQSEKYEEIYDYELYDDKLYVVEYEVPGKLVEVDLLSGKERKLHIPSTMHVEKIDAFDGKLYLFSWINNENDDFSEFDLLYEYDLKSDSLSLLIPGSMYEGIKFHYNAVENNLYTVSAIYSNGNATTPSISIYRYNALLGEESESRKERIFYTEGENIDIWQVVYSEGSLYFAASIGGYGGPTGLYKIQPDGSATLVKIAPYYIRYMEFDHNSKPLIFYDFPNSILGCYDLQNGSVLTESGFFYFTEESYKNAIKSALGDGNTIPYYIPIYSQDEQEKISSANITGFSKPVSYSWNYTEKRWSWSFEIDVGLYLKYKNINRFDHFINGWHDYSFYARNPDDDYYLYELTSVFKKIQRENSYTDAQMAQIIANFVQSVTYEKDKVSTGFSEYPKFPIETLFEGEGDCEDTSVLLASLYNEYGIDAVLIALPGHMAVAVKCDGLQGRSYEYKGEKYYYIETTSPGWRIGEIPSALSKDVAEILPIK